ncbi:hypothetical protein N9V85_02330 [Candidatus Pelagibacter bacterium]|nr:hypothetical protein [Candidatus Pelagibacter bacterium]
MIKQAFKKGQLYVNYLGPSSSILGNLIATPILISNLGIKEWSLFALISIFVPLVQIILFGSSEFVRRLMINIFLSNEKTNKSIDMFYKYEKKNFFRFITATIILSFVLIIFNSNNFPLYEKIELSFILISIAVFIKIFEFYYSELLNGLKQHYKLHLFSFIITLLKWISIIYLSFQNKVNINTLLVAVIIFSCFMLIVQRIFILNVFKKKKNLLTNQNKGNISEFNEGNFGMIVLLILLLQQFDKILVFGILDPLSLSYFGIAFMLSTAIPLIISPIIVYLTPEIYETVEINSKSHKKYFSYLIVTQFIILLIPLIIINLYIEPILTVWLGKTINSQEISYFLVPLSISTISISLLTSLKILFIADNKINLMKKPLIFIFSLFIFFTIMIYLKFLTIEIYLYCWSISMFFLIIYFYFNFFFKKIFKLKL